MTSFKTLKVFVAASAIAAFGAVVPSFAAPVDVSGLSCNAGNSVNGIAVGDVTGNAGPPSDCFGTLDGNDPGPSGDGIQIGGIVFAFLTKYEIGSGTEGANIGLTYNTGNGTWSFDSNVTLDDPWLLVLKQAHSPGWAAWLFEGGASASTSGTYSIAWWPNDPLSLSHVAIYGGGRDVPEPGPLGLLGIGMIALYFGRRRRFNS